MTATREGVLYGTSATTLVLIGLLMAATVVVAGQGILAAEFLRICAPAQVRTERVCETGMEFGFASTNWDERIQGLYDSGQDAIPVMANITATTPDGEVTTMQMPFDIPRLDRTVAIVNQNDGETYNYLYAKSDFVACGPGDVPAEDNCEVVVAGAPPENGNVEFSFPSRLPVGTELEIVFDLTPPGYEPITPNPLFATVEECGFRIAGVEISSTAAIILGVAALLFIINAVLLVAVVLGGRRARRENTGPETAPAYGPPAGGWTPEPTSPASPMVQAPVDSPTQVPSAARPEPRPAAPAVAQPPSAVAVEPRISPVGDTQAIQRAPGHLALLVHRSQPDRRYDLKGTATIGRTQDNQIVLRHSSVSRHHAWIKAEGEEYEVFDVGSTNGTYVNGERITDPRRLVSGDLVRFGDEEFVFSKLF
jgi:hypothetical protein